jgi:hypothetical protein
LRLRSHWGGEEQQEKREREALHGRSRRARVNNRLFSAGGDAVSTPEMPVETSFAGLLPSVKELVSLEGCDSGWRGRGGAWLTS